MRTTIVILVVMIVTFLGGGAAGGFLARKIYAGQLAQANKTIESMAAIPNESYSISINPIAKATAVLGSVKQVEFKLDVGDIIMAVQRYSDSLRMIRPVTIHLNNPAELHPGQDGK